jgi:hypothetical protein
MTNKPPSRGPLDPRREPDSFDDEVLTDVTRGDSAAPSPKPPLRLGIPRVSDDAPANPADQTEIGPSPRAGGIAIAVLPRSLHAWFEVKGPNADAPSYELTMVRTEIGRGLQADIRLSDRRLSRRNTLIVFMNNEFRIRDLGSGNGTRLNGSRVGEYVLKDGDEVAVGNTRLVFRLERR